MAGGQNVDFVPPNEPLGKRYGVCRKFLIA